MPSVTTHSHPSRTSNLQTSTDITHRVRRALVFASGGALLIGIIVGIIQVNPGLLPAGIPFEVQPSAVVLAGVALIGLIDGIVVGFNLQGTTFLLRLAVALVAFLVGWLGSLLALGFVLSVFLHKSLIRVGDTLALGEVGLGALSAIVGVLIVQRFHFQQATPSPGSQSGSGRQRSRRQSSSPSRGGTLSALSALIGSRGGAATGSEGRVRVSSQRGQRRRRQGIQLGDNVVQVCPYCFEEVKPNDSRGRVVCSICGTAHHADCWAVSGRCQVPHLQT